MKQTNNSRSCGLLWPCRGYITWGSGGGGDKARVILLQLGGGHRVAWNLEPGGDAVLCSQAGQRHLTVIPT